MVAPAFGIIAIGPIFEKVGAVFWMIARGLQKGLELPIGYRRTVDVEFLDVQHMLVETSSRWFPRIAHINADLVTAFDFHAANLERIPRSGDRDHVGWWRII